MATQEAGQGWRVDQGFPERQQLFARGMMKHDNPAVSFFTQFRKKACQFLALFPVDASVGGKRRGWQSGVEPDDGDPSEKTDKRKGTVGPRFPLCQAVPVRNGRHEVMVAWYDDGSKRQGGQPGSRLTIFFLRAEICYVAADEQGRKFLVGGDVFEQLGCDGWQQDMLPSADPENAAEQTFVEEGRPCDGGGRQMRV